VRKGDGVLSPRNGKKGKKRAEKKGGGRSTRTTKGPVVGETVVHRKSSKEGATVQKKKGPEIVPGARQKRGRTESDRVEGVDGGTRRSERRC